ESGKDIPFKSTRTSSMRPILATGGSRKERSHRLHSSTRAPLKCHREGFKWACATRSSEYRFDPDGVEYVSCDLLVFCCYGRGIDRSKSSKLQVKSNQHISSRSSTSQRSALARFEIFYAFRPIDCAPTAVALLEVCGHESLQLGPAEPAAQKHGGRAGPFPV